MFQQTFQQTPLHVTGLLQRWQADAFEFLQVEVPRLVVVLLLALLLLRVLRAVTRRLRRTTPLRMLQPGLRSQQLTTISSVLHSVGTGVIVFVATLQVLAILGINMGPLLASAGIAGLAIGFGAQSLVRDVINGFFILFENQYDIGDVIRVGVVQGRVEKMSLRSTLVREDSGALAHIPNGEIRVVSNLTRDWVQVELRVAAAAGEDPATVLRLLQSVSREMRSDAQHRSALLADPQVSAAEIARDKHPEFLILLKVRPELRAEMVEDFRRRTTNVLQSAGIKTAGPAEDAYLVDAR